MTIHSMTCAIRPGLAMLVEFSLGNIQTFSPGLWMTNVPMQGMVYLRKIRLEQNERAITVDLYCPRFRENHSLFPLLEKPDTLKVEGEYTGFIAPGMQDMRVFEVVINLVGVSFGGPT